MQVARATGVCTVIRFSLVEPFGNGVGVVQTVLLGWSVLIPAL